MSGWAMHGGSGLPRPEKNGRPPAQRYSGNESSQPESLTTVTA